MKAIKNKLVVMRDGIRIAVDIYLPDSQLPHGAVLYLGPYRKDDYILNGSMAQLPQMLTDRGLALVIADARGTNDSEGTAPVIFSEDEQQDGYELVEWIAAQPWCNGNVGMTGVSYGFWTSVMTAALRPPHLRTIVPIHGSVSWFYCVHQGGMPMSFGYHANYLALMLSLQGSPPGFMDERFDQLWADRIRETEPWSMDWFDRMADDASYESSSLAPRYDRVQVPVFAIGAWWDRYPGDALKLAEELSGPVKVLIGPWQHMRPDHAVPGPRVSYEVVIRWFEHWLNGVQNGVMDEPRFTYYMQDYAAPTSYRSHMPGKWRQSTRWPIPDAKVVRLHLASGNALQGTPASPGSCQYDYDPMAGAHGGLSGGIYGGIAMPEDQRAEIEHSAVFYGATLTQSIEIVGCPLVRMRFSSTASRMGVVVRLCDAAPDGTISLVTRGYLNLAHRDGLAHPTPPQPDAPYELSVFMKASAYRFAPGHRICLMVTSAEFPSLFPTPDCGVNTIFFGEERAYLELPTVEATADQVNLPSCDASDADHPPPERTYRVDSSADGRVEAKLEVRDVTRGLNGDIEHTQVTWTTLDRHQPAEVRLCSESMYRHRLDSGEIIESVGRVEYVGSKDDIHGKAELTVTSNGVTKATRSWSRVCKRKFV